jgi:multidrug efflux pump
VSLSVSLIAVLIPLLFMGDIVGRLFREFAVTLAVTIVISAIVSLTLTPMMCALILKRQNRKDEQGRSTSSSERDVRRGHRFYGATLTVVLRHQTITLLVAAGDAGLTVYALHVMPKGFFPVQDTGVILGISEAPQDISFPAMAERQQALAKVILKDPAVESLSSFIGVDGTNTTLNSGRIQINLKPLAERKDQRQRRDPPAGAAAGGQGRGHQLFMQPVQDLTVEDRVSRTQFQYSLEDPDAAGAARLGAASWWTSSSGSRSCATWPATSRTTAWKPSW